MTPFSTFPALGPLGNFIAGIFAIALLALHVVFADSIGQDIKRLQREGRPVAVLLPFAWIFAALMMGLVAVAFYWLCHYSRFIRTEKPKA